MIFYVNQHLNTIYIKLNIIDPHLDLEVEIAVFCFSRLKE